MLKAKAKVFIDASNAFFTQKKLGWFIDWQKLKQFLKTKYQILEFRYYSAYKENDRQTIKFFNFLKREGFILVVKPVKKIKAIITDRKGKEKELFIFKGNMDIEISRDILLDKKKYPYLILVSGDSDFAVLKKDWQRLGRKLLVVSSRKTISWELKLAATKILFLEDLKNIIFRQNWGLTEKEKCDKNKSLIRTRSIARSTAVFLGQKKEKKKRKE